MQRPSLQPSTYSGTPTSSLYSMTPSIDTATTQSTQGQRATYLDYSSSTNSKHQQHQQQPSVPERSPHRPGGSPPTTSGKGSEGYGYAGGAPPFVTQQPEVVRKAVPSVTVPQQRVRTKPTLLVAVAGTPDVPLITTYVSRMLKRATVSEIVVLGLRDHEVAFKQLKMEMYGLAGKLGRDLGVVVFLRGSWLEGGVAEAVGEVCGDGEGRKGVARELGAVVCFPSLGDRNGASDVLGMSSEDLRAEWEGSVGFVHAVARACVPRLKGSLGEDGRAFFLTSLEAKEAKAEVSINLPAVRTLMGLVERSAGEAITVGSAEDLLLPEPEPEPVPEAPRIAITGQKGLPALQTWQPTESYEDVTPPESPSKLWSMWQMQDEMGYVD